MAPRFSTRRCHQVGRGDAIIISRQGSLQGAMSHTSDGSSAWADCRQRNATDDGMLLRLPERSLGVPWGWRVTAPASRTVVYCIGASV
jgi:hypothetical protein